MEYIRLSQVVVVQRLRAGLFSLEDCKLAVFEDVVVRTQQSRIWNEPDAATLAVDRFEVTVPEAVAPVPQETDVEHRPFDIHLFNKI